MIHDFGYSRVCLDPSQIIFAKRKLKFLKIEKEIFYSSDTKRSSLWKKSEKLKKMFFLSQKVIFFNLNLISTYSRFFLGT